MTETTETARALLWRHNLPEDVIDGALALHAQELAQQQRAAHDTQRPYFHFGLACKPDWDCGVRRIIDLIDPTLAERPAPAAVPAARQVAAETPQAETGPDRFEWIVEHCPDHGCVEPELEACCCEVIDRLRAEAAPGPAAPAQPGKEAP